MKYQIYITRETILISGLSKREPQRVTQNINVKVAYKKIGEPIEAVNAEAAIKIAAKLYGQNPKDLIAELVW